MKTWPLRFCKGAPFLAVTALFGYTCAVITKPALVTSQLNAVILTWLGLFNLATLGVLFWALITNDIDELRAQQRSNPRLRFLPPLQAVPPPDMPAAPVWPLVVPQQRHTRVYGEARPPLDRIEEELREITRDMDKQRPEDSGDLGKGRAAS
jgi:hypothetical protein